MAWILALIGAVLVLIALVWIATQLYSAFLNWLDPHNAPELQPEDYIVTAVTIIFIIALVSIS